MWGGRIQGVAVGGNIAIIPLFAGQQETTMTLHLHDTRQGGKVPFEPMQDGKVTMYLCGPTVYNYAHIGNARPAVVFDVLARHPAAAATS